MGLDARSSLLRTALLLSTTLVLAQHHHAGEEEGPEMTSAALNGSKHGGHSHMAPPTAEDIALWNQRSYWSLHDHVGLMYAHIALMVLAWVVILPISK